MLTLGISQDLYDAGITLTDGEQVLYAANEERFTRRKNHGGFPYKSLEAAFCCTAIDPSDVELICVAGEMTPPLPMRMFPGLHGLLAGKKRGKGRAEKTPGFLARAVDFAAFYTPLLHLDEDSRLRRAARPLLGQAVRRSLAMPLRQNLKGVPMSFIEHHRAHAASAWFLSGFDEALTITGDGMGDGLSITVNKCSGGSIERLWKAESRSSLGLFFEVLTEALGFTPCRDEGKLTGLAAHGDADRVAVPSPFSIVDGELKYSGPLGLRAVEWAKNELADRWAREDVAAWAQRILETTMLEIAGRCLRQTGLSKLAVSGGVFGNVKLNQRLNELNDVEELFVCPNMGDGGLSLGAICAEGRLSPQKLKDVFWGDGCADAAIQKAVDRSGLPWERFDSIEQAMAEKIANGAIVARFHGRMEWGPRALGNRSILANPSDSTVTERLNRKLNRSDFMPFAPAALAEDMDELAVGWSSAGHAAEFMTVCFDCTPKMRQENPAVVHIDGTARMQAVNKETNPSFHLILKNLKEITGSGVVLNTSFNIHEEPIVRTPDEAVNAFVKAGLDYLAIGDYLVKTPQ